MEIIDKTNNKKVTLHVIFLGDVQGVGFRFTTNSIAKRYAISGWVKNRFDGSVELWANGQKAELLMFLGHVKKTFSRNIYEITETWNEEDIGVQGFHIKY